MTKSGKLIIMTNKSELDTEIELRKIVLFQFLAGSLGSEFNFFFATM